ncbi:hypothetical protein BHE90_003962 [Fusarium euwallaceae]|uniref:Uncharacterized protein n=1 Tax=Fusarium euwallaceae TaxID=1147111 RepID=A0A430M0P5_9HYPO|nr:hypothetical protein BHE90_003962 [Fusarium euwallaceae]
MSGNDSTQGDPASRTSAHQQIWSCDVQLMRQRFDGDADRLFATDVDEVEVWTTRNPEQAQRMPSDNLTTCKTISGNVRDKLEELWKVRIVRVTYLDPPRLFTWIFR